MFFGELVALLGPIVGLELAVLIVPANSIESLTRSLSLSLSFSAQGPHLPEFLVTGLDQLLAGRFDVQADALEVGIDGGVDQLTSDLLLAAEVLTELRAPVAVVTLVVASFGEPSPPRTPRSGAFRHGIGADPWTVDHGVRVERLLGRRLAARFSHR